MRHCVALHHVTCALVEQSLLPAASLPVASRIARSQHSSSSSRTTATGTANLIAPSPGLYSSWRAPLKPTPTPSSCSIQQEYQALWAIQSTRILILGFQNVKTQSSLKHDLLLILIPRRMNISVLLSSQHTSLGIPWPHVLSIVALRSA